MKYLRYNVDVLKENIFSDELVTKCRKQSTDFRRKRKLPPKELIYTQ